MQTKALWGFHSLSLSISYFSNTFCYWNFFSFPKERSIKIVYDAQAKIQQNEMVEKLLLNNTRIYCIKQMVNMYDRYYNNFSVYIFLNCINIQYSKKKSQHAGVIVEYFYFFIFCRYCVLHVIKSGIALMELHLIACIKIWIITNYFNAISV